MSPYASELAHARLDALRTLVDALNEAETPEEKRRCAVAILSAPDPCDLDDEIELVDDEDDDDQDDENEDSENQVSATQAESNVQENSAVEDAPLQTSPASPADIRHPPSEIPPDLSAEAINAKATTDLNREAMDQLVAPS